MSNAHVLRELSPYCEGTLPAADTARVAEHLLGCDRCRRALDPVRAGVRLARTLTVVPRKPLGDEAPAPGLLRKHIAYRRDAHAELNVLTWSRGEQSYALVSALPGVGQEACFVCHTDPGRRALIARLGVGL